MGRPCADPPDRHPAGPDVTSRCFKAIQSVHSMAVLNIMRMGHSTVIPATKGELLSIADSISMDRTSKWGLGFFQVCK